MKTRTEAEKMILHLLKNGAQRHPEKKANHFGLCELRELLDFLYETPPAITYAPTELIAGPASELGPARKSWRLRRQREMEDGNARVAKANQSEEPDT